MSITQHAEPHCRQAEEPALDLLIEARVRDLGDGFRVRRLLPAAKRRMVGPFIFFDQMGPVRMAPGRRARRAPAPAHQPGDGHVSLRGRDPAPRQPRHGADDPTRRAQLDDRRPRHRALRALAERGARDGCDRCTGSSSGSRLPRAHEEVAPSFQHHAAGDLPALEREGARLRVIAGSAYGATSPAQVLSPLFYVEARLEQGAALSLPDEHAERAAYVVDGSVCCDGEAYGPGVMLVFREDAPARIRAQEPARVMLLGGAPLDGERHIWWNFVSSSPERIERAQTRLARGPFPEGARRRARVHPVARFRLKERHGEPRSPGPRPTRLPRSSA